MSIRSAGMTYSDLQRIVSEAITDMVTAGSDPYGYAWVWVRDMTDDVAIYSVDGDETFEVPYTVDDGNIVTLGDPVPVVQVTTYSPVTEAKSTRSLFPAQPPERPAPPVTVRSEPLTYERHTPTSYYQDLFFRSRGDQAAKARLQRHGQEMDVEYRVNPDRVAGQGGNFAPPLWLISEFATAKRPERVLADLIKEAGNLFPCPVGVQSINIPVLTTGTSVQAVADLEADPDQDEIDTATTSPVVIVTGQADTSLQLLEQSPAGAHLDWAIFKDLTSSYDADLDTMVLVGTGTGGQFTGLLNIPGNVKVSYTDASPTFIEMYPFIGQVAAQVGDARDLPIEAWIMRSARWSWIGTQADSQQRPITPPELAPPPPRSSDGTNPTASMLGWPVLLDDAVPATQGAGTQDLILGCRPSDFLLFEGEAKTTTMEEVLSGTLEVRFQLRNYAAGIFGRYPSGIGVLQGTGLAVQSGF